MPCLGLALNVKGREGVESDLQPTRLSLLAHSEGQALSCRKLRGLPRRKADSDPEKGLESGCSHGDHVQFCNLSFLKLSASNKTLSWEMGYLCKHSFLG